MRFFRALSLFASIALILVLSGCRGITGDSGTPTQPPAPTPAPTPQADITSIKHILVLLQENRSFDQYFGKLDQYRVANGYGAAGDVDGLPANASNPSPFTGTNIASFHLQTMCMENVTPDWLESHGDFNLGNLNFPTGQYLGNGFVSNAAGMSQCCVPQPPSNPSGSRAIGYYDDSDLPYYYFMAANFGTSDRFFSPMPANSVPNRVFGLAATTAGYIHTSMPAINKPTIFSALDAAGITWRYYYNATVNGHPNTTLHNFFPTFADAHPGNFAPLSQYYTDAQNDALAQVSYFQQVDGLDEHPGGNIEGVVTSGNHIQQGAKFVKGLVDALMASPAWKSSVFLLSYDEGGGFYDHVEPLVTISPDGITPLDMEPKDQQAINPPLGYTGNGFDRTGYRVPLIVISPFAKKSYVSHTPADYTAFLKFIETRFNLQPLTARDAAQPDMTEFFDFNNPSWLTPPTPPAQPTNGACNLANMP